MKRENKSEKLNQYNEAVSLATFAILTEHGRMSVQTVEALRREMRELGCQVIVMKNTLARIVFERNGQEEITESLHGPTLLFAGATEIAPVAKLLQRRIRQNPTMLVKSILYDGGLYTKEQFTEFVNLPTREEVRSKLLGLFKTPQSMFVGVIGPAPRFLSVVKQYADKQA
jgi:large subunit ribosomal protein L10